MRTLGFPEMLVILFTCAIYGVIFFVVWKFYQILARMNENLGGIRRALEQRDVERG